MWNSLKITRQELDQKIAAQDAKGINPAHQGSAKLFTILGDPSVPKTSWWNLWYMIWRGWKMVVVFTAGSFTDWFKVGFIAKDGSVHLGPILEGKTQFATLIGYEDVTFFATDTHGIFIPLTVTKRMPRAEYLSSHYKTSAPLV